MPLLALLALVAYIPGIPGFWQAGHWIAMATIGFALLFLYRIRMTPMHWTGLAFVGWCALSYLWCVVVYDWANEMMHLLMLAAVFCVAAEMRDARSTWIALIIGATVNAGFAAAELLGWNGVMEATPGAGLLGNKNFLAEIGAVALIVALGLRLWVLAPGAAAAALLPMSTGSLLAMAAAAAWWLWGKRPWSAVVVALALSTGLAADFLGYVGGVVEVPQADVKPHHIICLPGDPARCLVHEQREALRQRWEIWQDTVAGLTWLGRGYGSFYAAFPQHADHLDAEWFTPGQGSVYVQPDNAHDEYLQIAFETGPLGLLLLAAFMVQGLRGGITPERAVMAAIMVQSLFSFPLHLPATGFAFAFAAGRIAGAWHELCGARSARRIPLLDGVLSRSRDPLYGD